MSAMDDVQIWEAQIARWREQADGVSRRLDVRRLMFASGAIGEQQFKEDQASLEADRLVYVHVIAEAEARVRAISGELAAQAA